MTATDVLLMIIIFSGSLLCLCVGNFILCADQDFTSEVSEQLQNKDTNGVVVIQKYENTFYTGMLYKKNEN